MRKENKKKLLVYLMLLLQAVVCGIVIGLLVGLYQFVIGKLSSLSRFLYGNNSILLVCVIVVIVIGLSFVNEIILAYSPGIEGSGIPNIELGIRNKKRIDWKKEIVLIVINSCVSTLAGFPLGSEGPSVVIGGKVSKMVQDVSKIDNNDEQTAIACGTGFGCAFLSPLAGLCYIFEESLHKFNPNLLLRAAIMMFSAYFTCSLVNNHHILVIGSAEMPMINEYYVFVLLMIVNAFVGMAFVKLIVLLKKFFLIYKHNRFVKKRGFVMFGIVIILNLFLLKLMGSGVTLIEDILSYEVIYVVILILLFRFVITIFAGSSKVTGGLVIPTMTLGAVCGQLVYLVCHQLFGLSSFIQSMVILVSMCMMFGVVTKTPITSIVLLYSVVSYSSGDYFHSLIIIPIASITIFGAYYISKLFKVDCIYEQFMEISLKYGDSE